MTDDILLGLAFENLHLEEDSIDNSRKLFIGGLSWMTTEDGLRQYFENLGLQVESVVIMRDKTGRSRGFGFITLASVREIDLAISCNLFLDGRKVEAKKAIPKSDLSIHAKKIFVGGIPMSLTNLDFRKYFESFGKVLETQIMTDRESGRSRGFGFVTFEEEGVAAEVLILSHTIQGKPVEVKQAEPKNNSQTLPHQGPPISPIYFPSNLSYSSAFNNPLSLEQATYLAQTQGGVVYVPHVYEPLDGQGYNIPDQTIIRRNTVPVLQKNVVPSSSNPLRIMPSFYEKQTEYLHTPQTHLKSPIGLELRTERAFSEPRTERSWNMPDDVWGPTRTGLGKYSPPLKRKFGSQSISIHSGSTLFSNPPSGLLRTDPNWFKSSLITTESTSATLSGQKYFQ